MVKPELDGLQAIEQHDGAHASELVRAHVLDFYRAHQPAG